MARWNILLSGYSVADEVINRASSAAAKIGHDTIRGTTDFEIWTGAGKTGTKLTITTDYVVSSEDTRLTTAAGIAIYTKLAIVNGAYLSTNLYVTYKTVGDYASVENVLQHILDNDGLDSALEAGDAGKVSRYGVGAQKIGTETDLNNYIIGGKYITPSLNTMSNVPTWLGPSSAERAIIEVVGGANYSIQTIVRANSQVQGRRYFNGSAWNDDLDGNAGQPPAPKPNITANTAGNWNHVSSNICANGQTGGTYAVIAFNLSGQVIGAYSGIAQGYDLTILWGGTTQHVYYRTAQ